MPSIATWLSDLCILACEMQSCIGLMWNCQYYLEVDMPSIVLCDPTDKMLLFTRLKIQLANSLFFFVVVVFKSHLFSFTYSTLVCNLHSFFYARCFMFFTLCLRGIDQSTEKLIDHTSTHPYVTVVIHMVDFRHHQSRV